MDENEELQKLNVTFKLFGLPNQVGRITGFCSNPLKFWISTYSSIGFVTRLDQGDICFRTVEELIHAANEIITNRAING
jgi:hypothetical protein